MPAPEGTFERPKTEREKAHTRQKYYALRVDYLGMLEVELAPDIDVSRNGVQRPSRGSRDVRGGTRKEEREFRRR